MARSYATQLFFANAAIDLKAATPYQNFASAGLFGTLPGIVGD
jgi:hypothetical protein